jgi:hypothetical protein
MKCSDFGVVLKLRKFFFSSDEGLLLTTGVQLISRLPHGPFSGAPTVHIWKCVIFKIKLDVLCD